MRVAPAMAPAAAIMRSPCSSHMRFLKPSPSSPIKLATGTRQLSNRISAVSDEVVAFLPRGGGDASHVGAGIRLCDRERGDLLTADRRDDPFAFLLLSPELEDGWRRHLGLNVDRHAQAAQPGFGHLLREHDR